MKAAGLIFSNIHDKNLPEMTAKRTMASLPFGGRYRLVDFTLSNMVNSGVTKIGIITHNNYRSLVDHIGTGKDWDLARRSGGVMILPPFITTFDNPKAGKLYATRLEALMGALDFITHCDEDVIILSDCDSVCNINFSDILKYHEANGADATIVTKKMNVNTDKICTETAVVFSNEDGTAKEFIEYTRQITGEQDISTNIVVLNKEYLLSLINTSIAYGYTEFYHQALTSTMDSAKIIVYHCDEYYNEIGSIQQYFKANMDLLKADVREQLFGESKPPIYTKVRNSAPTKIGKDAVVKNSLIADGCVIEGTVENSILFRGVRVRKNTVVKNCVLLQDTSVGENVKLNCVISDKNANINDERILSGHETHPFYIAKGKTI